ncbi:MAG: hypothetical protein RL522_2693 [Pseudomonadota bacterium]|jgi:hypothetical protein
MNPLRATRPLTNLRALGLLLAALCGPVDAALQAGELAAPAPRLVALNESSDQRNSPLKQSEPELAAPVSLATASPEVVLRSFVATMLGRWGTDCSKVVSSFKLEDGRILGETYFNGQLGTRSAIRMATIKYVGMANGLHRFEYLVDSRNVAQGESYGNRVMMETDLRTVRRSVYSEQLSDRNVLIKDGILLATNTPMPMQLRCP